MGEVRAGDRAIHKAGGDTDGAGAAQASHAIEEGVMQVVKSKFGAMRLRAWGDFFEMSRMKLPAGDALVPRMQTNIEYYAMNYVAIVCAVACLLVYVL